MSKKALWKSTYLETGWHRGSLESYWQSSKGAFPGQVFDLGGPFLETNLSWSDLRDIFSFAGVPFPKDWVTDTMPTDERYPDDSE